MIQDLLKAAAKWRECAAAARGPTQTYGPNDRAVTLERCADEVERIVGRDLARVTRERDAYREIADEALNGTASNDYLRTRLAAVERDETKGGV